MHAPSILLGAPWSGRDLEVGRRSVPWLLGGLSAALLFSAAMTSWWTYDEPNHLEWSRRLLNTRETERRSKGHFKSTTPVSVLNAIGERAAHNWKIGRWGFTKRGRLAIMRWPGFLWLALLLFGTYWCARRFADHWGATVAVGLVGLDFNILAHAGLITVDAAFAVATLATLVAIYLFAQRPTLANGALLGIAFGFAFVTKYSAVLLIPCLLLLPLAWTQIPKRLPRYLGRVVLGVSLAVAVAFGLVCAFYLFADVARPASQWGAQSSAFKSIAAAVPGLRLPLPHDFITGLDLVLYHEREKSWNVYLFGSIHPQGVWYFFPVVWLLKTPVLVVLLSVSGLVLSARAWRQPLWRMLAAGFLIFGLYFCFIFRTQVGFRYILMCVPLLFILGAPLWSHLAHRSWGRAILGAAFVTIMIGHVMYLGNPLAYTNLAVWPKRAVYRLIADSNVKWGQMEDRVEPWVTRTPELTMAQVNPSTIQRGWNMVGVNRLTGVVGPPKRYQWLRDNIEPTTHFRHSYVLFDVSDEEFDRYLNEQRTYPPPDARVARVCKDEIFDETSDPVRFDLERQRRFICVRADRTTDVTWTGLKGLSRVGHFKGRCTWDESQRHQRVTFRLEPGLHALCLLARETPIGGTFEFHEKR